MSATIPPGASRRQWRRWLAGATLLLLTAAAVALALERRPGPGTRLRRLRVGEQERTYLLHVPPGAPTGEALPLVLALHGRGGWGRHLERLTHFSPLADRERFLVAYPDGLDRRWRDGRPESLGDEPVDDLAFLVALISDAASVHPVDRRRVYVTGMSNGGIMSHSLGGNRAEHFAAIAPVVGGMPEAMVPAPAAPVSVLILQGTEDPIVPYHGGALHRPGRGRLLDTDEAARRWAAANACQAPPRVERVPNIDPRDGCTAERTTYGGCRAGTEVVLIKLRGGGHTWPGGPQYLPRWLVGGVCRDLDGTAVIWDFFRRHGRP